MAVKNQTNVASINILCTEDATNNVLVNRSFAPSLDAQGGQFASYDVATVVGLLPAPPGVGIFYNVYLRNLNAPAGGIQNYSVVFQAGLAVNFTLQPGDVFLLWGNSNATVIAGSGITSLSVVAGGTGFMEYFLGA